MHRAGTAHIKDYALIGNCRTAALVSKWGSIDWCCFPRFDSPSLFAAVLDRQSGGYFAITPAQADLSDHCEAQQTYLDDTNIAQIHFTTPSGRARLQDCFTVASEEEKKRRLWPDHEILRIVDGLEGEMKFQVCFRPRPDYGESRMRVRQMGKWGLASENDHMLLLQASRPDILINRNDHVTAEFTVKKGERVIFSLSFSQEAPAVMPALAQAEERFRITRKYWQSWLGRCRYSGPYQDHVMRSALALKLLIFAPSGAIVAAPTLSLPEKLGGERNWDYRYCWLRDASFTIRALLSLGFDEDAEAYASWLMTATRLTWPKLQVLYSVYGEAHIPEVELPSLAGYENSGPVRRGNAASGQLQLDVYGEVLDAFFVILPRLKKVDADTKKFVLGLGDAVLELWRQPDDGIWEMRRKRVHHTHSKVMAWVAMDRLDQITRRLDWKPRFDYRVVAEHIRDAIEENAWDEKQRAYTGAFNSTHLDAAVLMMPLVGYCPPDSPRMLSTLSAIQTRLTKNGLVYRYKWDDGLEGSEGAFGMCNFWMAGALVRAGKLEEARFWIDALLKHANSTLLWPEEIDPDTGGFLGNYPQAFTHIGVLRAGLVLQQAEKKQAEKEQAPKDRKGSTAA